MLNNKAFTVGLTGLGLAASLFVGCQNFLGQKTEDPAAAPQAQAPQEVALMLAVKDSGKCLEMQQEIKAVHESGTPSLHLDSLYVSNCVKEIAQTENGKPNPIPKPELVPDNKTRCHWIMTQIDVGREDMLLKFRYYCPDECLPLGKADSIRHEGYCRDPKPNCEGLQAKLSTMDKSSQDFERLHHLIADVCLVPRQEHPVNEPPVVDSEFIDSVTNDTEIVHPVHNDSVVVDHPLVSDCEVMRHKLDQMDSSSMDFARLKGSYLEHCMDIPHPEPAPVDSPIIVHPVIGDCEAIKLRLSYLDSASEDYARLKGSYAEHCKIIPCPVPPPVVDSQSVVHPMVSECDGLRLKLSLVDSTSAEYVHIKELLNQNCTISHKR